MTTVALGNLTVAVAGDRAGRRLVLSGRLDETVDLVGQVGGWLAPSVVIDSAGILFINSIGIREWMHFLAGLEQGGAALVHERCAEPLIEQMCFIPAVRGNGEVRSFHAPYLCERCGSEISALIDVIEHGVRLRAMQAPPVTCARCQAPMELADVPERLFAFLREPTMA